MKLLILFLLLLVVGTTQAQPPVMPDSLIWLQAQTIDPDNFVRIDTTAQNEGAGLEFYTWAYVSGQTVFLVASEDSQESDPNVDNIRWMPLGRIESLTLSSGWFFLHYTSYW